MEVFKSNVGGDFNGGLEVYDREATAITYHITASYQLFRAHVGTDTIDRYISNSFLIPLSYSEVI
jgi:hypothetical protein